MQTQLGITANSGRSRRMRLREAVLGVFHADAEAISAEFAMYCERDWESSYPWLDSSGLALYLMDRLVTLGCEDALPSAVRSRLRENFADNRKRTEALFAESIAINRSFREAGVVCANLKGITLWPNAVPDPALRCQMDLDLLVREEDALKARQILEQEGYFLYVVSGDTWEFRAGTFAVASRKDLYKPKPQRTVDLHLASPTDSHLARAQMRAFHGELLLALSPVDLFLAQALHLSRHISGAFTRAGWVLEYRRHVLAHYDDPAFWEAVESRGKQPPQDAIFIGIATLLASKVFGEFAPRALNRWTVDRLPAALRLWVELYGCHVILADFPGTKLYLLLQKELGAQQPQQAATIRKQYLPLHLPPLISHSHSGERILPRLNRYRAQAAFVLFRLRFHLLENLRYTLESSRWRRSRGLLHEDA